MKTVIECVAISEDRLQDSPKLKTLLMLEAVWFDSVLGVYYINIENPLATLLLMRFPVIAHNGIQPITVTVN